MDTPTRRKELHRLVEMDEISFKQANHAATMRKIKKDISLEEAMGELKEILPEVKKKGKKEMRNQEPIKKKSKLMLVKDPTSYSEKTTSLSLVPNYGDSDEDEPEDPYIQPSIPTHIPTPSCTLKCQQRNPPVRGHTVGISGISFPLSLRLLISPSHHTHISVSLILHPVHLPFSPLYLFVHTGYPLSIAHLSLP
jgi:hypothetical protein